MKVYKKIKNKNNNSGVADSSKLSLESLVIPSYEEVMKDVISKVGKRPSLPKSLPKGEWTEQALKVLSERYLIKDKDGKVVETPEEMCWRVSWEIASAEARWGKDRQEVINLAKDFYKLMLSHEFLPNSPTLMNAGTGNGLQYSACFVIPVEDSMEGIFDALKYQAMIHKTGGGTGFGFSRLRPNGSQVRTSSGTASGPVSFMRIFDAATNEVKQGGKRRGANMGIMRVDHPDILEFIHCKEEGGITNFNISVTITDDFMKAYEEDRDYDLKDPRSGETVGKLSARKVFNEIADGAWRTGDPGLVFIDRINKSTANPVPGIGPIEATNPCGEQPLYPFDACNLGSIFLNYFVKEGTSGKKEVDWDKLKEVTRLSVRFLDNVIEVNPYPLQQIRRTVGAIRRIGLGIGGWADMLVELGIPYKSEEALKLAEKLMKTIQDESVETTQELARERGPFPLWPVSIYKDEAPRRNSTVTTIAPTGSISIIAGSSSGIEPLFAIAFQHIVKDKHLSRTLTFINPGFEQKMKDMDLWTESIKDKVSEHGTVGDVEEIPHEVREVYSTAHEIHHDWHIKMQAAFQKYTENAVSKTINMANSVTVEDIKRAYLLAWKTNCRGITVFRDGCKDAQVLNMGVKNGEVKKATLEVKVEHDTGEPLIERPFMVIGATYRMATPLGTAFITINQNEHGEPMEVFIIIGKAGSDVSSMADALGRTISAALRFRGNLSPRDRAKEIASQLAGIMGRRSVGFGPNKILSLPDAVASALSTHFGFGINGFAKNAPAPFMQTMNGNGHLNTNGHTNGTEAKSDLAEAVMSAQIPAQAGFSSNGKDDHTTALAGSYLASNGANGVALKLDGEISKKDIDQLSFDVASTYTKSADICPSCGASSFVYQEGCAKCYACGHSEC